MSVSRISSSFMMHKTTSQLQNNLAILNKIQQKIGSGRNITMPSDDPLGMTQLFRLGVDNALDERYTKNVDEALGELASTDQALSGIIEVAQRAQELATAGANATNSTTQLTAMANEVGSLLNQLVQLGNTSFAGRSIFAGYKTDAAAFTLGANGMDVSYDGTPSTDPWERMIQVAKNSFVQTNINGEDILGSVTVVAGVPAGSGLLYDVTKLKLDLEAVPPDYDAIRANINMIKTDMRTVMQAQSQVGGRVNQLEMTRNRIEDHQLTQEQEMGRLQEVDMAKEVSNLNFQQTIYQASLGMMSKMLQTSLVNFLQ